VAIAAAALRSQEAHEHVALRVADAEPEDGMWFVHRSRRSSIQGSAAFRDAFMRDLKRGSQRTAARSGLPPDVVLVEDGTEQAQRVEERHVGEGGGGGVQVQVDVDVGVDVDVDVDVVEEPVDGKGARSKVNNDESGERQVEEGVASGGIGRDEAAGSGFGGGSGDSDKGDEDDGRGGGGSADGDAGAVARVVAVEADSVHPARHDEEGTFSRRKGRRSERVVAHLTAGDKEFAFRGNLSPPDKSKEVASEESASSSSTPSPARPRSRSLSGAAQDDKLSVAGPSSGFSSLAPRVIVVGKLVKRARDVKRQRQSEATDEIVKLKEQCESLRSHVKFSMELAERLRTERDRLHKRLFDVTAGFVHRRTYAATDGELATLETALHAEGVLHRPEGSSATSSDAIGSESGRGSESRSGSGSTYQASPLPPRVESKHVWFSDRVEKARRNGKGPEKDGDAEGKTWAVYALGNLAIEASNQHAIVAAGAIEAPQDVVESGPSEAR
jgi:hypothetical protein